MKHFTTYALGALALLVSACSADEPTGGVVNDKVEEGDFYATLSLQLPSTSGTRADEGSGNSEYAGEEFGQDSENKVSKVLVVLAYKDAFDRYQMLTYAMSDAANPGEVNPSNNTIKYVLNFKSEEFDNDPLQGDETLDGTKDVYVFTYCNPSDALAQRISGNNGLSVDNIIGTLSDPENDPLWESNKFLMTNKEVVKVEQMPDRETLINNHGTQQTAFNLGTIRVVRSCARFDFQTTNDNKYTVYDLDGKTAVGEVELTKMALINLQKNYYLLPRTSNIWNWTTLSGSNTKANYTLCGDLEGFVMSYNSNNFKNQENLDANTLNNQYFYGLINNKFDEESNATKQLVWTSIKPEVWNGAGSIDDNHNSWDNSGSYGNTNYKIWRYATENTIPGQSGNGTANQKVGISTGVAFYGEFTPENREVWNGHVVYVYKNIVYGDFNRLKSYIDENPNSIVASEFAKVGAFKTRLAGSNLDENLLENVSEKDCNGFTAYVPTEYGMGANAKYEMYYYYYNRHNSNGRENLMGENEFGVVRNNVYKLAVTKISRFGSPKSPEDPDTPNETESAYFTVSCLVMPWTVRLNNIEF